MSFHIGERVLFLNETGSGRIVAFLPDGRVRIEDEDGFLLVRNLGEICKILKRDIDVKNVPVEKTEDVSSSGKSAVSGGQMWEIDLHIEQLLESTAGMTNHEIVMYQMNVLKSFLDSAKNKKIRKVLIIHGVGEGKLRSEVHSYLRGVDGAIFHNEHYTPKGFGATLVELFYRY
jgi:dsDNA-specific endonuclease/ATPase MutS2